MTSETPNPKPTDDAKAHAAHGHPAPADDVEAHNAKLKGGAALFERRGVLT